MTDADKEHRVYAELHHRFEPFMGHGKQSLFETIRGIFSHHHHHSVIDTSKYQHKPLENYSEKQIVDRTVFALKKIHTFNHHFVSAHEARLLRAYEPGLFARFLQVSLFTGFSICAIKMYSNCHFSAKSAMLLGGFGAASYGILRLPNFFNEMIITPKRRAMAQRYIDAYGAEFFHEIINPQYDAEKLRHLHSKFDHFD